LIVKHNTPIGFGIITANNEKNALERIWLAEDATYAVLQLIQNTKDLS